jgi:uncharacterized protein YdiU (UPF0061 family)
MDRPLDAQSAVDLGLHWENRFRQLGVNFFTELQSDPAPAPQLVSINYELLNSLGVNQECSIRLQASRP